MFRMLLTSLLFLASFSESAAQYYKGGVGLRFGYGVGGTVKFAASTNNYIEIIGTFGALGPGYEICFLYERHLEFRKIDGLAGVVGIGPGVVGLPKTENYPGNKTSFGIDPIIGLDYTLSRAPINFSIDFKPRLHWVGGKFQYNPDFGVSCRYVWGR